MSLEFGAGATVDVGRLGIGDREVVFEQRRAFAESGLVLHALFPTVSEQVIYPKAARIFEGLHGVFADSLPDAWGRELLRKRAQAQGVNFNSLTALDRLALVGASGPGALTYRPMIAESEAGAINLDVLSENALAILQGHDSSVLDDLIRLGGSSGGARPKISVAMNARGELRPLTTTLADGFEAWIIKFRSPNDPRDAGAVEAAYADMARAAGLDVAQTTLLESKLWPGYFATRRFDRPTGRRLHMVSSSAILETDWSFPGDYETLFKLTRRVTRDQRSVETAFRRAVFNVMAKNRDDHWKQHAFLMDASGSWSIAPSYDLTFSAGPGGEHYLAIGGRGKPETAALLRAAYDESIDKQRARDIIEEVAAAIARFAEFAKKYDVGKSSTRQIAKALGR